MTAFAAAGPYSAALNDPSNAFDAPVPGFVGPDGIGKPPAGGYLHNVVNPVFFGWASAVTDYLRADGMTPHSLTSAALGEVTGNEFDVVSLGDLSSTALAAGDPPGQITLTFQKPIRDFPGADFAVFENGLISAGGSGVSGQIFGELAYVEVSTNGVDFARFPSRSMTPALVGAFGTIDATGIFNLAGKHTNTMGGSWGTPFDLSSLANDPLVLDQTVDLNDIRYVRIVDVPGNGSFLDSEGDPIYDSWDTSGTGRGGFDLEAIGVIGQPITFEEWLNARGLTSESMRNLLAYAFAIEPEESGSRHRPAIGVEDGRITISFVRDVRRSDLRYVVQVSDDMEHWEDIAQSVAGGPMSLAGLAAPAEAVVEESADSIRSLQVLRRVTVTDAVTIQSARARFLRVEVRRN